MRLRLAGAVRREEAQDACAEVAAVRSDEAAPPRRFVAE